METQNITAVPQAIYSPAPIAAEQFVDGIRRLSEGIITKQKIYDYLVAYEIRAEDLERYKMWLEDRHTRTSGDDDYRHDDLIDAAESAEGSATRNLFDLRTIIGGLFVLYGVYLTVRGILDSQSAVTQAAGVRINLWTGLFALVLGSAFLLWAFLRPLTIEEIIESQAEDADDELGHEELRAERERAHR